MLTVRLHGHLEEKFGAEFKFEASTIREVIDALQANFSDFTDEFIKDDRAYNIIIDNDLVSINECVLPINTNSTIDIVPIIAGAGNIFASVATVIIGVLLVIYAPYLVAGLLPGTAVGAGGVLAGSFAMVTSAVSAVGYGLALAGVASLLAGPDGPDGGGTTKARSFGSTENVVGQGMPVPLGYGRLLIGSFVLSSTYSSSWTDISPAYSYYNTSTSSVENIQFNWGRFFNFAGAEDEGYNPAQGYTQGYNPADYAAAINNIENSVPEVTYDMVVVNGRVQPRIKPGSSTTINTSSMLRR